MGELVGFLAFAAFVCIILVWKKRNKAGKHIKYPSTHSRRKTTRHESREDHALFEDNDHNDFEGDNDSSDGGDD